MSNELWVEKYRPSTIDECILPELVKSQAKSMVESGNLNHLLLSGGAGTGKTTLAKAICAELGADYIMYNGSDGSLNLEELRENISDFAQTGSLKGDGKNKVIIIDEADGLDWRIQPALRNALEKYAGNCRFILTCNFPDKIMDALQSRCATIDYKFEKSESNALIKKFAMRTVDILKAEGISYDVEVLKGVIMKYYPDNRKILNELQMFANRDGCIDHHMLDCLKSNMDELFAAILKGEFTKVKDWLANHSTNSIFNVLYREGSTYIPANLLPLWILKLGDYQRYHGSVPNMELNVLACLTEFMAEMG